MSAEAGVLGTIQTWTPIVAIGLSIYAAFSSHLKKATIDEQMVLRHDNEITAAKGRLNAHDESIGDINQTLHTVSHIQKNQERADERVQQGLSDLMKGQARIEGRLDK